MKSPFYKNPDFPLVPGLDDIRHPAFQLLGMGWQIVDSVGEPLNITDPGQIAVSSVNLLLRRRPADPDEPTAEDFSAGDQTSNGDTAPVDPQPPETGSSSSQAPGGSEDGTGSPVCKRYRIRIPILSVTNPQARNDAWKLFAELRKVSDSALDDLDYQLIQLDLTLTTVEGQQGDLEAGARDLDARWDVEDDES